MVSPTHIESAHSAQAQNLRTQDLKRKEIDYSMKLDFGTSKFRGIGLPPSDSCLLGLKAYSHEDFERAARRADPNNLLGLLSCDL